MTASPTANIPRRLRIAELQDLNGQEIGVTDWLTISQSRIDRFAECTEDSQWIHVDAEKAKAESIFKTTIAHGFLTLSLTSFFVHRLLKIEDATMVINYGLNRVRFPSPVRVDSQLRARVALSNCEPIKGGAHYGLSITIEVRDSQKPACVAELIFRALY
ncbi:MAG: putative enoyl-CoA hydratase 1 [Verrucomicrobia subdivision 3 bacterium]|nr:putative enoyl-CoA hydratase 1 [Limisphaerales bacterium]MCS1414044.1 putative enoyl-CoA hydratase 1 [Limisphaerales bacterium]